MKTLLKIFGTFAIAAVVLFGIFLYMVRFKVTVIDTAQSADGVYEVTLQAIGEPDWPYGSASGRLILMKDKRIVSKTDVRISDDGIPITKGNWRVAWSETDVEITLSGSEQYDELVELYYDGQVERSRLTTHYGKEWIITYQEPARAQTAPAYEPSPEQRQIEDGYRAIYKLLSDGTMENFEVRYGANEASSKCILFEDENTVEYVIYDRKSKNEACGLYVHYKSKKDADGGWSASDGTIVNSYAYIYESGDVVSSDKTHWEDIASEAYQEAAGES